MPRTRYFKQAVRVKPTFDWTSDPVPSGDHVNQEHVHFSSFKLDTMAISTGDFVLVRNTDSDDFKEASITGMI